MKPKSRRKSEPKPKETKKAPKKPKTPKTPKEKPQPKKKAEKKSAAKPKKRKIVETDSEVCFKLSKISIAIIFETYNLHVCGCYHI